MGTLAKHLPAVIERFDPELVVYLAGCDPADDDPLGDWRMTADGLLARDLFVYRQARGRGPRHRPMVVLLSGGYGDEAWRYTARFVSALLNQGRALEPPSTDLITLEHYRSLDLEALASEAGGRAGPDDWGLNEEDLLGTVGPAPPRRFLGRYTRHGIERVLQRTGVLDRLRDLGFRDPMVDLDLPQPGGHTLRLWCDPLRTDLLLELRLDVDRHTAPGLALLRIEWLLLQNPRAAFTPDRPRLPGQKYPGLGVLRDVSALLILLAEANDRDGILMVPSHYHVAALAHRYFQFLEPAAEGRFLALQRALAGLPLAAATDCLEAGRVRDVASGEPVEWVPAPMVLAASQRLRDRFDDTDRRRQLATVSERLHYMAVSGG